MNRRRNLATCLSAVLLFGLSCGSAYATGNQAKPPGGKLLHVKVRTVDTAGKPIAGALVETWQNGGERLDWWNAKRISVGVGKEVRTGKDGSVEIAFSLAAKPSTSWTPESAFCLTAQASGYLVTRSGAINSRASDHFEVVLTLRRLVSVEGRVIDQQGQPVAGALVFHTGNAAPGTVPIFAAGRRKNGTVPLYATDVKTDAQGHFRLEGLPEGKSPVFVTQPGYHFHGQLIDSAARRPSTIRLLTADQSPPPLRTLPPLRSHEEELKLARQLIRPLWEAAMKVRDEGQKEWSCEQYASIDPWAAYDYVNTHLSKGSKNHFVSWKMPLLYSSDPEEALDTLESLDSLEYMKAFALLNTAAQVPNLSRQQKLDLLDRATQHLRATTDAGERVLLLSRVAVGLFELDRTEESNKIVQILAPAARQLSPKRNAAAVAAAGEAISLFDLPRGLKMIHATHDARDGYYWQRALFHVIYRIAKQQPAEAQRFATEAIGIAERSLIENCQREHHRGPTEEELQSTAAWYENRLVPLCYNLALGDAARAERMATAIHNPFVRAYALGMVAKALARSDKARARRLLLCAYDVLTDFYRSPDRNCLYGFLGFRLPAVATALLAVVEEIDPTLVQECLWKAVSFRLPRTATDFLLARQPEWNDASTAAFVARYDRQLARVLLPARDTKITPLPDEPDYQRLPAVAMIDVKAALEELRAEAALPGADAARCFRNAYYLMDLLAVEGPHRWDFLTSRYDLWLPDNQYVDIHAISW